MHFIVWLQVCVHVQKLYLGCRFLHLFAPSAAVDNRLGGNAARTAHPDWPKGYSMPRNVMLSNKTKGNFARVAQGLAEHCSAGCKWELLHPLLCFADFCFFYLWNRFYLTHPQRETTGNISPNGSNFLGPKNKHQSISKPVSCQRNLN